MSLYSPDGKYHVLLTTTDEGQLTWSVRWNGKQIILPSPLGMVLGDEREPGKKVSLQEIVSVSEVDTSWKPVYGDRSLYRDHYNKCVAVVTEGDGTRWELQLRAYNEGIAFRYVFPDAGNGEDSLHIRREHTTFTFPAGARAWVTYSAQGRYERIPVKQIKKPAERPLVVEEGKDVYVAVGEAALVDYARMRLAPAPPGKNGVVSSLAGEVVLSYPAVTPWRFVMAATEPGRLVENNFLLLNLNAPCALQDVSWIRPGKVIREVTLTTRGGRACVDFAATHGLQFVEFDAGWYGHEYDTSSDATTVTVDPKRSPGPLDLPGVIGYARQKDVGIILYVNRRALEMQLDTVLPLYASWGVSGVKYGFVRVGPQQWTSWLHEAIRKAASHHLMVDVHDEYRPTGYQRTWPNFMTCEGVRGDEEAPGNHHTLITMFTRTIAGPADNTICYFTDRVTGRMRSSHASQLAKAVCIYSPWQFLFWYDRPAASRPGLQDSTQSGVISEVPELDFFRLMPTVWDDTKVIEGRIGEYGTFARRSGDEWYVGSINGESTHTLKLSLNFLDPAKKYRAIIYADDPATNTRTHVRIEEKPVEAGSNLSFDLLPNTGLAMRIVPEGK